MPITSVYGYERDTTPNLRRFARDATRFEAAYSATASTGPTHATLFTGLHPIEHGLLKNGMRLAGFHRTLAEALRDHGFQTSAVVSSFVLDARFGFAQGFESYDDDFLAAEGTSELRHWEGHAVGDSFDRRADHTTRRALRWLEQRDPARPFFLFVHYFDPHLPYAPPPPFDRVHVPRPASELEAQVGRYDGEIAFTDREIGRLLDGLEALGLGRDTLVAITADHGEGLMQHGALSHGIYLYEGAVRVPLLLRWPAGFAGARSIAEPVGLVDLPASLLALCGAHLEAAFGGRSLAAPLRDGSPVGASPVWLYRRPYGHGSIEGIAVRGDMFGVREGRWKYIEARGMRTRELYDLEADPLERENRIAPDAEVAARMAAALETWQSAHRRPLPKQPGLDAAERRALESLGYVE